MELDIHNLLNQPGNTILQLCREKNLTLAKLAELSGLSNSQLSRIVNGSPDSKASSIKKIAHALGIHKLN